MSLDLDFDLREHPWYRQVVLRRHSAETTAWVPEEFAVLGKSLSLRQGSTWVSGWVVTLVGVEADEAHVNGHNRAHLHYRDLKHPRRTS